MKKLVIVMMLILALGMVYGAEKEVKIEKQAELSIDEIVKKANLVAYYGGKDGISKVKMVITGSNGRTRKREFTILRKNIEEGGKQKFYVYFSKPNDVRKLVFMVHKYLEKDDDRWLFVPAINLVKRISASDKRSSFVGSNFTYEDVSGRSLEEDKHTLLETTKDHYVIKNVPKNPKSVDFAWYKVFIDKKNFMPVKAEYYNSKDKIYRRVSALEVKEINGIPTVTHSKVENLEKNSFTESKFTNIKYNVGIQDSIFTERYLRRPPTKWIR